MRASRNLAGVDHNVREGIIISDPDKIERLLLILLRLIKVDVQSVADRVVGFDVRHLDRQTLPTFDRDCFR